MKFPARVGVVIIAGLLACGAIPAAHAATTSPPTQPASAESQQETQSSSLKMPCQLSVDSAQVTISFSPEAPFDELTVSVDDQAVAPQQIHDSSVVLDRPEAGGTATLELWENESLTGECDNTIPPATSEPPPPPSTESPDPPETDEPTPTETESSTPPTSPTPSPSPTPTTPSETPSESQTPTPSASPSASSPSTAPSDSPMSTRPTARPENTTQGSAQRPHSPVQQQPEAIGPRNIRQYSNDPRYLLHQLLGIPGQSGSELIMPRPRNADQGPPDLETLPPVSEDELEAIKARLTAPNRADRPANDQVAAADEQTSNPASTWLWLLPSFIVVAGLGGVTFWLLKRRQQDL